MEVCELCDNLRSTSTALCEECVNDSLSDTRKALWEGQGLDFTLSCTYTKKQSECRACGHAAPLTFLKVCSGCAKAISERRAQSGVPRQERPRREDLFFRFWCAFVKSVKLVRNGISFAADFVGEFVVLPVVLLGIVLCFGGIGLLVIKTGYSNAGLGGAVAGSILVLLAGGLYVSGIGDGGQGWKCPYCGHFFRESLSVGHNRVECPSCKRTVKI